MTTNITPVELIDDEQKQLVLVAQQNGLQAETAQNLQASFAPLFAQAKSILEKSRAIQVTDISQKLEMDLAKKCRIALKNVRVAGDKIRKEQKEESLKKGRAIDGFFAILDHLVSTEETRLTEQEKFAEIKEAERKAALKVEREEALKPFAIDLTGYALGEMNVETFDQLLLGTRLSHEAKIESARKSEAERIAKEAAEQAERIRIQAENERLKKDAEAAKAEAERVEKARIEAEQEAARVLAEERRKADEAAAVERQRVAKEQAEAAAKAKKEREEVEAKAAAERAELKRKADEEAKAAAEVARKEREAIEAKAKAEREAAEKEAQAKLTAERAAREKVEAMQQKAAELEKSRLAAEKEALRKAEADKKAAAAAPDREKLLAFAATIRAVPIPTLSTEAGIALTATIKASHDKFVNWINEKAGAL